MAQILVRQLDEGAVERLRNLARAQRTSVEALARAAIHKAAAALTAEEKIAVVQRMQAITERAKVPGMLQTPGVDLIREDRDR